MRFPFTPFLLNHWIINKWEQNILLCSLNKWNIYYSVQVFFILKCPPTKIVSKRYFYFFNFINKLAYWDQGRLCKSQELRRKAAVQRLKYINTVIRSAAPSLNYLWFLASCSDYVFQRKKNHLLNGTLYQ